LRYLIIRTAALFIMLTAFLPASVFAGEMTFFTIFHVDKDQTYNCTFGLRDDAIPGYDPLDLPAPPAPPEEDLDGYLTMIEPPPYLPNRWYKDFRPVSNLTLDRVEYYPFHLVSSHIGELASISIATGAFNALPYEMWVQGPNGLYEEVPVPGSINFTITSSHMFFYWELRLDDQVATSEKTWAGVKSLYR